MFSKFDKAYVAAIVSFISLTAMQFFGVTIDANLQNAIVAIVSGMFVFATPNKA